MTERLERLINFLKEKDLFNWQLFYTRNIIGDYCEIIYSEDEIVVYMCMKYGYLEIIGLTLDELNILSSEHFKIFDELGILSSE